MRRIGHLAIATCAVVGLAGPTTASSASAARLRPATVQAPASLVDTLSGTLGPGFPMVGASLPFGMIQPGPDTSLPNGTQDPVDYTGYSYQDPDIRGFSLTHFDGAGIQIAGDLPFMPTTGAVSTSDPLDNTSPYAHASEIAQPGYYAVTLARDGIRVELTSTLRAAMMRFTFPSTTQANVIAEVDQSVAGAQHAAAVTAVGDTTLQGWALSPVGYKLYFDAVFDRPFSSSAAYGNPGEYVTFDTTASRTVTMRVGISYVSEAGAIANLNTEIPAGRTFDDVHAAATAAWNRALDRVQISGGTVARQRTFYDNLYRSFLDPNIVDDADGQYLGLDGQLHQLAPGQHHYSNLSGWDIYRSEMPLLELAAPQVARGVLTSLIDDAEQNGGVIPRWVQANIDRGIMGGDSGSAILADGAAAGLLSRRQTAQALSLLLHQANTLPAVWPRENLGAYLEYGYIPQDVSGIGTSETLEYDIDDNAVAQLAAARGDGTDAAPLRARAGFWHNLIDPSNHFIQPRDSDGSWADPVQIGDPTGETGIETGKDLPIYSPDFQNGYQEGTGWQYLWSVPQDPAGLAGAIGGDSVAIQRLDRFFGSALNQPLVPAVAIAQQWSSFFGVYFIGDQYTSVNEPDLWAPWFYDFYGEPWKTQRVARAEMSVYNQTPEGLPGNDDAGEMSAWYVLAALGLYHAAPGVDAWELNSPEFPSAVLAPAGGRRLTIEAPGAGNLEPYVHALTLGGAAVDRTYLTTCQLDGGGELDYALGAAPDESWGTGAGAAPPSDSNPSAPVTRCAAKLANQGGE
jgi:predicted alpha-1,2-mannosidase